MTDELEHRTIPGFRRRLGDPNGRRAEKMQDFMDGFFGREVWEGVSRQDDGRPGYAEGLCFAAEELDFQQGEAA